MPDTRPRHRRSRLRLAAATLALGALSLSLPTRGAEPPPAFPGTQPTRQLMHAIVKAEEAFQAERYDDAYWHYARRLAPVGDKHSQYMVGYLYLHGLGVPVERARAYAWYRLAAERGEPVLVRARNELGKLLTPAERAEADAIFDDLRAEYGDRQLLAQLIRADRQRLRERTGSRVGGPAGPISVLTPDGRRIDGDNYYREVEARLERRLEYLSGHIEYGELGLIDDDETETPPPE